MRAVVLRPNHTQIQLHNSAKFHKNEHTALTTTEGYLKKKNWFKPGMIIAQIVPINQARRVFTGKDGSSALATAERTSGYGESSSAKKVSILKTLVNRQDSPKLVASLSKLGSSNSATGIAS